MKKLPLIVLFMAFGTDITAQPIKFLDEKTAFCYSEQALSKYLNFVKNHNLDVMNELVIKSKCDFVPDGEIVRLENYRINTMGNTKVVELELEDQTPWTFNALLAIRGLQ